MKVLFLTRILPFPYSGNSVRTFNWLRFLGKKHEIHLLSFIESEDELEYIPRLKDYCSCIKTVLRKPEQGFKLKFFYLFGEMPYCIRQSYSESMQKMINDSLENNSYDLIHANHLMMTYYIQNIKRIAKIAEPVDCLTRNSLQQLHKGRGFMDKIKAFIDWRKIRSCELSVYSRFDYCILASVKDREFLERLSPDLKVSVISNGVDFEYFKPQATKEDFPSLLFTGDMSYPPNEDAVFYLCSDILPLIEKSYPDVKLYIVGKRPSYKLERFISHRKNVILTGFVEDIRTYLAKATIFICPLRRGTGIKNKVLEAMAMGKAVISSSIGQEGIDALPERDIIIADNPKTFAQRTVELLSNKDTRDKIALNGRKIVEANYNWKIFADKLDKIYQELKKR